MVAKSLVFASLLLLTATNVEAGTKIQQIGSDRGGYVVKYALKMLKLKKSGVPVQFTGKCQSACTIYLALGNQACIKPGASFVFHTPYGASASGNKHARMYMMNSYPGWVKSWIASHGGLTSRQITMSFSYAKNHMKAC